MMKKITSLQNKEVKWLLQLQEKSRARKKEKAFLVEGLREIGHATNAQFELLHLYYVPGKTEFQDLVVLVKKHSQDFDQVTELSSEVYEKIAYRGSTEGVLAVFRTRDHALKDLELPAKNPLLLVAEAPEKPGNIGALLRTADAAGVDAVIIANPKTDLYNPNIIRSSVGCVFTNKIATGTTVEIIEFLQQQEINIYAAILQEAAPYHEVLLTGPAAIVVGTEATGLSDAWREQSFQNIIIPMQGAIDSMNVSVAAGVLVFEARRQRGFKF